MNGTTYTYNDYLIVPQYSEIRSRTLVDISTNLNNLTLNIPIISANMRNVTGDKMAASISSLGGLGLLHRFCSIEDNVRMYSNAVLASSNPKNVGVSIGVKEEDKKRFESLYNAGARIFCIDIAHGHSIMMLDMLKWINGLLVFSDKAKRAELTIIAGNIATAEGYRSLAEGGADVVKCGIGPGFGCTTRINAGVGVPQLDALALIHHEKTTHEYTASIIADGGIRNTGDIAKSLRYADAVMIGSMLAGHIETPGDVFVNPKQERYKTYGGSASAENKGNSNYVEGIMTTVPFKGSVEPTITSIKHGVQSAFSYVGAIDHKEFQQRCKFVKISNGAQFESKF